MPFDPEEQFKRTPYENMTPDQRSKYAQTIIQHATGKIGGPHDGGKFVRARMLWKALRNEGLDLYLGKRHMHIGGRRKTRS